MGLFNLSALLELILHLYVDIYPLFDRGFYPELYSRINKLIYQTMYFTLYLFYLFQMEWCL